MITNRQKSVFCRADTLFGEMRRTRISDQEHLLRVPGKGDKSAFASAASS